MSAPFQGGKAARKPTRIERAVQRQLAAAARTAAICGGGLAVSGAADVAVHSAYPTVLVAGGLVLYGAERAWEAYGWHRQGGKAAMRRRRKYQGAATAGEIREKLSPRAARKAAARTCPDLHPSRAPVVIGRGGRPARVIAGSRSDSYLVVAPPQTMKTALMSCWAADAPGLMLGYSSRCDQYRHTAAARRGDVWVLNADGDGGIPTQFAWSPVDGCGNEHTAIRRAGDLMHAAPRDASGKDAFWEDKAAKLLRYMLRAAALSGASMREVAAWVHDPASGEPVSILEHYAPAWAQKLAALTSAAGGDYLNGVTASAEAALGWMDDPVMAAVAGPRPGCGINLRELLEAGAGSIYMIGADRPHGSLAPYFAAFGAEAFETAKSVAENQGGRLRIPFTIVADEAATICPLPFHKMTAASAGYNITVIAGIQALSQLPARWGEHDAKTIRTNFTTKIIGGGITDPAELRELSEICGQVDTWDHIRHPDGSKTRQPRQEPLFAPERIRMLPPWHALVLHRNTRPVEVEAERVWERPGYQGAAIPGPAVGIPEPQPAIQAPHPPIALPAPAVPSAAFHVLPSEEDKWQQTISSASTPN